MSVVFNTVLLSIWLHPFQNTRELQQSIQLGWAIRGMAEHSSMDTVEFQNKCINSSNFEHCSDALKHLIMNTRQGIKDHKLPLPKGNK